MSTEYIKRHRAPPKEDALVLIAVDTGGKNKQELDQTRIWAAPTASPETSTVLEGILGRWGGLWLPVRERTLTAVTQEKYLLFLCFHLFSSFFWIFFLFSSLCCSCWFYWHYDILFSFWVFFNHPFFCCYKHLPLFFFFNFNFFKPIIIFTFIPLFAFPIVLVPFQLIFSVYKSSLPTSI